MNTYDFAIVGGGLVGSAIAYGLAKASYRVAVLDEGDVAYRASRGNFGLVWVQGKGLEIPSLGLFPFCILVAQPIGRTLGAHWGSNTTPSAGRFASLLQPQGNRAEAG